LEESHVLKTFNVKNLILRSFIFKNPQVSDIKKAMNVRVRKSDQMSVEWMHERRCERERWARGGCDSDSMWKCLRKNR
jgi:hypothetical protein